MARKQPRLISIPEATTLTGHSEEALSQWCATGRLSCERIGSTWYLLESDLHEATRMSNRAHPEFASGRAVLALAFNDPVAGRRAFDELKAKFGPAADELAMAPMSLDGRELVLIAGTFPQDEYQWIEGLAARFGGLVVDDVDEAWTGRSMMRAPERRQGQDSYG